MQALTVYCSSSTYLDPAFHAPAHALGAELARRKITLVYGGGSVGLMGEIARTCQAHGGTVHGIITQRLCDAEQGYADCDELVIVDTMQQRKAEMMKRGEGFLVLPGGVGTYEEFFEVLVGRIVGEHTKPIGIVNSHRYYDPLIELMQHGIEHKFIKPAVLNELMVVGDDVVSVLDHLVRMPAFEADGNRFMPMGQESVES
jgi:uncharacterized protein (TIGR00730 family)